MSTHLFTNVSYKHMNQSARHCLDEIERTREHLAEMQDRFDETLNRCVATNIWAGFQSANYAQQRAFKEHSEALALLQQYIED